jgi:hypothetical protein
MRCSRSAVAAINRKFQIRLYEGKRSHWSLNFDRPPMEGQPLEAARPLIVHEIAAAES